LRGSRALDIDSIFFSFDGKTAWVTTNQLGRRRLRTQGLEGRAHKDPEAVVRFLGAMQAQDYAQALWAVAVRTAGATVADVERAIAKARIVRTWPMRGTIHFVPAADAKWMLALSALRMLNRDARRLKQLEIDEATLKRSKQLFQRALAGGKQLSRKAMMTLLEEAGIPTTGQRGYHLLWHAAQIGLICPGPMLTKAPKARPTTKTKSARAEAEAEATADGVKEQSFVLLDEWVPNAKTVDREEALGRLAGRYFTGHGPATMRDFAWWGGLSLTDAKAGIAGARPKLLTETIGGVEHWRGLDGDGGARNDARVKAPAPDGGAHLLPAFDEYLIGYADRSAVLAAAHVNRIVPGGNGIFMPIIVADGQVVGTWRRKLSKDGGTVEVGLVPFKKVSARALHDMLEPAANRYAAFLGRRLASLAIIKATVAVKARIRIPEGEVTAT
jgi:hypothetical protein